MSRHPCVVALSSARKDDSTRVIREEEAQDQDGHRASAEQLIGSPCRIRSRPFFPFLNRPLANVAEVRYQSRGAAVSQLTVENQRRWLWFSGQGSRLLSLVADEYRDLNAPFFPLVRPLSFPRYRFAHSLDSYRVTGANRTRVEPANSAVYVGRLV
ncbi:hypothetical protein PUN28_013820 [Cardiocondyla obscurior]|uniref:Uncharacterized protein n=1 Tax=Cardiocondyla obscurior TaxID=286306 RepID=A0AAW2F4K5_9HYME